MDYLSSHMDFGKKKQNFYNKKNTHTHVTTQSGN
jgi:hypothetical protein